MYTKHNSNSYKNFDFFKQATQPKSLLFLPRNTKLKKRLPSPYLLPQSDRIKTMAVNNLNSHLVLTLISLFFLLSVPKSLSDPDLEPQPMPAPPTVWDILPKYGLPSGLLPSTVTDYSLQNDGRFIVVLKSPCYVQFEYLVYYEKTITGKLGYGSITDLKGIQVKRFFLWLDVDEIKVDLPPSGSIYFQVGFINKKLDIDQFKTIHSCRDGVIGPCGYSWKSVLQLPMATNEIQMLVTE